MKAAPSIRRQARTALITAVLLVVAVFSLLPLYVLVVTAFKSQREYAESIFSLPTSLTVGNFEEAWSRASIGTFMLNSLVVSLTATVLCLTAAAGLAFAIVFLEWRGRRLAYGLCLVLLAVPALLLLIPVFDLLVDLRLVNTLPGIILLYSALSLPFATFLLVSYMRTLPTMVVEAAVLDGISVPGLLGRVVLPLSRPAVATAAVLTFIFCWNEFIYAFVVLHSEGLRTLPAGLAALQGRYYTNFPVLLAGVTISVLPVLVVYLLSQRFLARGIAVGVD